MKTIENWETKVMINGEEKTGIPLPGCIVVGELENKEVRITAADINLSKLTVTDTNQEQYLLSGPRESYVTLWQGFIEYAKRRELDDERGR